MELNEDAKVSPKIGEETSKVEPGDLLEEGWFFGNSLDRKTKIMSRCFSDPSPSSKVSQDMLPARSHEETYSSINKSLFPNDDHRLGLGRGRGRGRGRGSDGEVVTTPPPPPPRPSLMRTPSMPSPNRNNSSRTQVQSLNYSARNNDFLQKTPSLPGMDMDNMDNIEDEESDYSMGKLIRQASLGQSRTLPPRQLTTKKSMPSSIPKQINPRKTLEQEGSMQRRRQQILKQAKNKTRFSNIEIEQGNDFIGSNMVSPTKETKILLPMLQEEKAKEENEDEDSNDISKVIRKSYVPQARRLARTTSASPVLDNIGREKTADDMKAQIKFWARTVASNVV